jgi:hypothetical protein
MNFRTHCETSYGYLVEQISLSRIRFSHNHKTELQSCLDTLEWQWRQLTCQVEHRVTAKLYILMTLLRHTHRLTTATATVTLYCRHLVQHRAAFKVLTSLMEQMKWNFHFLECHPAVNSLNKMGNIRFKLFWRPDDGIYAETCSLSWNKLIRSTN